ncbi:UPF0187-domain-containing protein [Rickenella mellea]|uniref:UPF0187-domain-containing protein n=1 Tax=Rickenella mellea TaxID=50990 RepID=A0A4Y7PNM2_9AGAM|nr:UPF0187-domain-containing protein [Rickenella mellea]
MPSTHLRSYSGQHTLLPAENSRGERVYVPLVPTRTLASWTFGRGTVIWNIWPAVILHTVFAAVVTVVSLKTNYYMGVPPVMITVLGVVIGFVIAYRASSGYDRYWMGRCCWSDITRTSRTFGRLAWIHVPLNLANTPSVHKDEGKEDGKRIQEMQQVMREKRMALELVEGFSVALKHHLRGEMGIMYEDLYHLVRPLHDHPSQTHHHGAEAAPPQAENAQNGQRSQSPAERGKRMPHTKTTISQLATPEAQPLHDPAVPAVNSYGSTSTSTALATTALLHARPKSVRTGSVSSARSSVSSCGHDGDGCNRTHRFLLPSAPNPLGDATLMNSVSGDLIPFETVFRNVMHFLKHPFSFRKSGDQNGPDEVIGADGAAIPDYRRRKHRPRVAGGGENLPLEILRCLSEWLSVLEARGTVSGNALGGMYGCVAAYEDSLSALERILTTPLPFVYSAHISAVWLYLFLLPFQLVDQFMWFTIPGVALAAFFYIGFLAAGEEIEEPFGYDRNDLDLDLFCREIINRDVEALKMTPCANVYMGSHHSHGVAVEATHSDSNVKVQVQDVFGTLL